VRRAVLAVLLLPGALLVGLFLLVVVIATSAGGGAGGQALALGASQAQLADAQCQTDTVPIDLGKVKVTAWTDAQKSNAAKIVEQVKVDVPAKDQLRAAIVALMTAMQESGLNNINYGDRDSIGLFQQRNAWGSSADRMDPHKSAHMFLTGGQGGQRGLLDIKGWQSMPFTVAAQSVQVSAFPTAYAKWESQATALAAALMKAGDSAGPTPPPDPCGGAGGTPGSVAPGSPEVEAMLAKAKTLLGTPYVYGGTNYPPGVDCSGLLVYSYRKTGHPLRIRTSEQMWANSTPLAAGTEKRGDLVFSEFVGAGPGHVMIVWDPAAGTVIEAPHTGDVVKFLKYKNLPGIRFGRLKPSAWAA
jgi:cell wall-associated NlpC family hydrolase